MLLERKNQRVSRQRKAFLGHQVERADIHAAQLRAATGVFIVVEREDGVVEVDWWMVNWNE